MAIESSVLSGLEPGAFWQRFEELTTIARPWAWRSGSAAAT